jgi:hypothetical protein
MPVPRIDRHPMLARIVAQQRIEAIDAILDRRVGARHPKDGVTTVRVLAEAVFDDLPSGREADVLIRVPVASP